MYEDLDLALASVYLNPIGAARGGSIANNLELHLNWSQIQLLQVESSVVRDTSLI